MQSIRKLLSCVVAGLLLLELLDAQQPGNNDPIEQRIAALPDKAHVVLHLSDGSTMRGRIVSRNSQDFALRPDKGGTLQTIAYRQIAAVERVQGQHSKAKWIVIGIVAGAAIVVAVIAIHVLHSPTINGI